ncbi:MAG TPA: VWA domain-containing protein [Pyrinomonadaceae bacterium]|jgi:Ca-activated chloride channel family protein|nr:VWA domain-containing protein [Pyrinomonadaceae bacterium]
MTNLTLLRALCLSALCLIVGGAASSAVCRAQGLERELEATAGAAVLVSVKNLSGRVTVVAAGEGEELRRVLLKAESPGAAVAESDVKTLAEGGRVEVEVREGRGERDRVDLFLRVPRRARVKVETRAGAVDVSGSLSEVEAATDTGTIRADVPLDSLRYSFRWTASRPRFYSETELGKVEEKRGGRFEVSGRFGDKNAKRDQRVKLDFETERGVILFGVDPAGVPADLRERQLTEAARAIIRSGNQDLIEAIRKITPRFVGEYAKTLPPPRGGAPVLTVASKSERTAAVAREVAPQLMRVTANVTDRQGRAIAGLERKDFSVSEGETAREVLEVEPARTPFNLVLLLDVSGSVEERLDFVRKSALAFVNTVSPQDRIAIISFRDDVQLISGFTTDRSLLAQRIKDIDAGGGTALYDALAYTLVETLKPLRDERTAIVVVSDGDDNRSFIPFPYILETIIETGAVIYPLYIPSGLIPAASAPAAATTLDPTRTRYLSLTSRADEEGRKLASVSGGVYYPVRRFDELQLAYDDIVAQLRTSYTISYATTSAPTRGRVRVRVAREGAVVRLSPAVSTTTSQPN